MQELELEDTIYKDITYEYNVSSEISYRPDLLRITLDDYDIDFEDRETANRMGRLITNACMKTSTPMPPRMSIYYKSSNVFARFTSNGVGYVLLDLIKKD